MAAETSQEQIWSLSKSLTKIQSKLTAMQQMTSNWSQRPANEISCFQFLKGAAGSMRLRFNSDSFYSTSHPPVFGRGPDPKPTGVDYKGRSPRSAFRIAEAQSIVFDHIDNSKNRIWNARDTVPPRPPPLWSSSTRRGPDHDLPAHNPDRLRERKNPSKKKVSGEKIAFM